MSIIWKLVPKNEDVDYIKVVQDYANGKRVDLSEYDIKQIGSIVHTFKDEIETYVLEHGLASLISIDLLLEAIVAPGTPQNKIVLLLQKYLDKVGVDNELIIVDPYFYSRNPPGYVALIEDVIRPYIPVLDRIVIVTSGDSKKYKAVVQTAVETALLAMKPTMSVTSEQSENYHDRFWISGAREKGIITGTSLNGFGSRYALIDRLNTSDVRTIVNALKFEGFVS